MQRPTQTLKYRSNTVSLFGDEACVVGAEDGNDLARSMTASRANGIDGFMAPPRVQHGVANPERRHALVDDQDHLSSQF
jgi:hypothetical protein